MKVKILASLAALLLVLVFGEAAHSSILTYEFSGVARTDIFNATQSGDTIAGTFTFDSSTFTDLQGGDFSAQEFPTASVSFSWSKLREGVSYTDTIVTKPVVQITGYSDFVVVTNPSASSVIYFNLESDDPFYSGAWMNFTISYNGEINQEQDILNFPATGIDFQYLTGYTNGAVHACFTDVEIKSANPVPLPATALMFGSGLIGLLVNRIRRKLVGDNS